MILYLDFCKFIVTVPDFDTENYIGPAEYSNGFENFISNLRGYFISFLDGFDLYFKEYNPDTNIYTFCIVGYSPEYNDKDQDILSTELECVVKGHIVKDDTGLVYLLATSLEFDESQFDIVKL